MATNEASIRFGSIRPLVRYVDKEQAIIDAVFTVTNAKSLDVKSVELHSLLKGPRGREYSHQSTVLLENGGGVMRFSIGDPRRWWPAAMGEQALYEIAMTLLVGDEVVDTWKGTLGMTSVRMPGEHAPAPLLVNGRQYEVQEVIPIDRDDEDRLLPVGRDCLLLIRDHFGPDLLYEAADRAGILLVQAVPLSHDLESDVRVRRQVDRLAAHPSLAGWLVDPMGRLADRIAGRVRLLDPTRNVLRELPCVRQAG